MSQSNIPHEPPAAHPDDTVALGRDARVRDTASGASQTVDEWLAACAERESRPIDECRDELMNAIARGDIHVENTGTGA